MAFPQSLVALRGGIPVPVRGALWMTAAGVFFSSLTVLIRHSSGDLHPFEIAFFRNLFGLAFILPWLLRAGIGGLRTRRFPLYMVRAGVGLAAMLCWFTAITMMPIAELTALSFTAPLFATIGAVLIFGEKVRARRWAAIIVGFAGAMIVLRPGVEAINLAAVLGLAASAFMGVSVLVIKSLSRTEPANAVVLYMVLLLTPMSLIPALFVWSWPAPELWFWLAAMGLAGTLGHMALVRSFRAADISAVLPFDFTRLIFTAILGYVFFAEEPDAWTWVGGAVIFAATLYTAHREARLGRPVKPARETLRQPPMDGAAPAPPEGR